MWAIARVRSQCSLAARAAARAAGRGPAHSHVHLHARLRARIVLRVAHAERHRRIRHRRADAHAVRAVAARSCAAPCVVGRSRSPRPWRRSDAHGARVSRASRRARSLAIASSAIRPLLLLGGPIHLALGQRFRGKSTATGARTADHERVDDERRDRGGARRRVLHGRLEDAWCSRIRCPTTSRRWPACGCSTSSTSSRTRTGRRTVTGTTSKPRCGEARICSFRRCCSGSPAASACITCTTSRRRFRTTGCSRVTTRTQLFQRFTRRDASLRYGARCASPSGTRTAATGPLSRRHASTSRGNNARNSSQRNRPARLGAQDVQAPGAEVRHSSRASPPSPSRQAERRRASSNRKRRSAHGTRPRKHSQG